MIPMFTIDNIANRSGRYAKLLTQTLHRYAAFGVYRANGLHLRVRQLCHTVRCAARFSFLAQHILRIVVMCAEEQVIGPATAAIVATMKTQHTRWDWAIGQLIRKAMRRYRLIVAQTKISVPYTVRTSGVKPAIAGLVNLVPEAGNVGCGILRMHLNLHSGVMPPAARTARGLRVPLDYSTNADLPQWGAI